MNNDNIIHPRPSSIVASLYTLRDLEIDVVILHGPPGCSFKHARLLESENVHVLTSCMTENDFVFGAKEKLKKTVMKSIELFNPKSIAIVGTCTSMIIGEDLKEIVIELKNVLNKKLKILCIEIHAGYSNNTEGVIAVLKEANKLNIIDNKEIDRQIYLLKMATELEIKQGAASEQYIPPSFGDIKYDVAKKIYYLIKEGKKGVCILNAKKETAYMFIDEILSIYDISLKLKKEKNIYYFFNLDKSVGLPITKKNAENILFELKKRKITINEIIGGLDEYAITKNKIINLIKEKYSDIDFIFISGVPHIISKNDDVFFKNKLIFSITNGPRQVIPLKKIGHDFVIVEMDLHPKTLGHKKILDSEFGCTLRKIIYENN